jgi:hypothetical protein
MKFVEEIEKRKVFVVFKTKKKDERERDENIE